MVKSKRLAGTAMSMPGGIAMGVCFSVVISIAGALIMTAMISNQSMPFESVGMGCVVLIAAAALSGAYLATLLVKRRNLLVCGITGLAYFLILLSVSAMFFGGTYSGVGMGALMVLLGAGGATALSIVLKKKPNWNKRNRAFR